MYKESRKGKYYSSMISNQGGITIAIIVVCSYALQRKDKLQNSTFHC